jgi:hypothetical protein
MAKMTTEAKAARKADRAAAAARMEAVKARRAPMLAAVRAAIGDGRAYLDTCFGRFIVMSYNDETGNAHCRRPEGSNWASDRQFMVCLETIKIA